MNQSGEAADQVVKMSLEGIEVSAKITGIAAKNVAALLCAILKDKRKVTGKTKLTNMLKSGKELKVFSIKKDEFKKFTEEAKRYGILYSALINKKDLGDSIDIIVRAEDAARINRIIKKFKLSSYDEATIRNDIEKTRSEKESKDKGIDTSTTSNKTSNERKNEAFYKEEQSINPHSAKTEKGPLSEHSSATQKASDKGTKVKSSVKEKLNIAKDEVKRREQSKQKTEVTKIKKKSKEKTK